MNGIKITPSLQCQKEIDTMLRNATRDTTKIRDFISKEKNELQKTELTTLFTATLNFAERFDGCNNDTMATLEFKKAAKLVFQMVANQKRGGRKIMFVLLSSPTSGLEEYYCSWWCTVRGLNGQSVRLMESYLKRLTLEIAAEEKVGATMAEVPTLNGKDAEVLTKKKIEMDVLKAVRDKIHPVDKVEGYSIATTGNSECFTMTVTLLKRNDDSGLVDHDQSVKEELPVPLFAHVVPKSEAARTAAERPVDTDGFWIDTSDDDQDFVQVPKMTPKGCIS